ncbi:uncharacterized protein BJX67DRAFT_367955 [Aspergillus lucknowensis]|uniref:Uncharacterized protein n=1 Tax=Aspergillus lucknowensis TaxID=176173 RepID=A0ABR4L8F0_9EURO
MPSHIFPRLLPCSNKSGEETRISSQSSLPHGQWKNSSWGTISANTFCSSPKMPSQSPHCVIGERTRGWE